MLSLHQFTFLKSGWQSLTSGWIYCNSHVSYLDCLISILAGNKLLQLLWLAFPNEHSILSVKTCAKTKLGAIRIHTSQEIHKIFRQSLITCNDFAEFARGIVHRIECVETKEKMHENFEQLSSWFAPFIRWWWFRQR